MSASVGEKIRQAVSKPLRRANQSAAAKENEVIRILSAGVLIILASGLGFRLRHPFEPGPLARFGALAAGLWVCPVHRVRTSLSSTSSDASILKEAPTARIFFVLRTVLRSILRRVDVSRLVRAFEEICLPEWARPTFLSSSKRFNEQTRNSRAQRLSGKSCLGARSANHCHSSHK